MQLNGCVSSVPKNDAFRRWRGAFAAPAQACFCSRVWGRGAIVYPTCVSNTEPSTSAFQGRQHLLPLRVYYEDTDFTGLVYHANYLRYFERGRSDCLRTMGVHHSALLAADPPLGFAVNHMTLDFLKPARIDDALIVQTAFETMRGPRIFIAQSIERAGERLVRAQVDICCISLTGRPRKPPHMLVERLKPFLEPAASTF